MRVRHNRVCSSSRRSYGPAADGLEGRRSARLERFRTALAEMAADPMAHAAPPVDLPANIRHVIEAWGKSYEMC